MKLTETQIKLAEQLLLSIKSRESVLEYNELASRITPKMHWRQVGKEIGELSKLCYKLGLPLISAMVISKGKNEVGKGFYGLINELEIETINMTEHEIFKQEIKKIHNFKNWKILADYLEIRIDFDVDKAERLESNSWIIPANNNTYDIISEFEKYGNTYWRQSANYKKNDIIYMYLTKPHQKIMYKALVLKTDIPYEETREMSELWNDKVEMEKSKLRLYSELQLINYVDTDSLSLKNLLDNGLKGSPQGPQKPATELLSYIENIFQENDTKSENDYNSNIFPEELDHDKIDNYFEGAKKQITVNSYERDSALRKKCIDINGTKCKICDFDFGRIYGKQFYGKIHVHHLNPLHMNEKEHKVNPKTDLIPVCPNCHMILHSKKNGVYTPYEVGEMIKNGR